MAGSHCTTLLLLTVLLTTSASPSPSSTYRLSYDALISPTAVSQHASNPINQNPEDPSLRLIPPTIAEYATRGVGTELFRNYVDFGVRNGLAGGGLGGGGVPLGFGCFPQETEVLEGEEGVGGGTICSMDYNSGRFSFQIISTVYRGEGTLEDYGFEAVVVEEEDSEKEQEQEEEGAIAETSKSPPDKTQTTPTEPPLPVAIRIEITLTTTPISPLYTARNALIEILPVVTAHTHASAHPVGPIWTIEERLTPFQRMMRERRLGMGGGGGEEEGRKEASLDTLVLSNSDLALRIPVISSSKAIRTPPSSSSDDDNDSEDNDDNEQPTPTQPPTTQIDIWHTLPTLQSPHPHRSLYLNQTLRTSTHPSATAHSEAFIHPPLQSHSASRRILLLSSLPLSHLREILKYENVEEVVLLGVEEEALEEGRKWMMGMDDCGGIEGRGGSCLDGEGIGVVGREAVGVWLEGREGEVEEGEGAMMECDLVSERWKGEEEDDDEDDDEDEGDEGEEEDKGADGHGADDETYYCSEHPYFDVVMIDVASIHEAQWLDPHFLQRLKGLMTPESVMVLNAGSAPRYGQGVDAVGAVVEKARDYFLEIATKGEELGGLGFMYVHVYDEPLAKPLNDAFIIAFNSNEAYYSFIQKNPTGSEIEFIRRMRPQTQTNPTTTTTHQTQTTILPTTFYDGYSHERYITPSRSWENWFCTQYQPGRTSYACQTFRQSWSDRSHHSYATEVRHHPVKGRSLHTSKEVKEGHFLLPQDSYLSLQLDYFQWAELDSFVERFPDAKMFQDLYDFFIAYGFETYGHGSSGWSVSYTNATFTNHACTEEDVAVNYLTDLYQMDDLEEEGDEEGGYVFSPLLVRRVHTLNQLAVAVKDLEEGDEVMIDYSNFRRDSPEFMKWLDGVCRTGVGLVPVDEEGDGSGGGDGGEEVDVEVEVGGGTWWWRRFKN